MVGPALVLLPRIAFAARCRFDETHSSGGLQEAGRGKKGPSTEAALFLFFLGQRVESIAKERAGNRQLQQFERVRANLPSSLNLFGDQGGLNTNFSRIVRHGGAPM